MDFLPVGPIGIRPFALDPFSRACISLARARTTDAQARRPFTFRERNIKPPLRARLAATVLSALLAASTFLPSGAAAEEKRVRLQIAGAYPSSMSVLGPAQTRIVDLIKRLSAGSIDLRFAEPGDLMPSSQYFDAIAAGSLDAAYTAAGYFTGKDPAFALFTAVPFGPGPAEYLAWLEYGGGNQLMWDLHEQFGIVARNCGLASPEAGGWFVKEITSPEDFKGLRMRFFGLGAKVMQKLGVVVSRQRSGEIFQALELGTIDASEFSMPSMDLALGFHQVAKFYYFPGWHQQASVGQLYISKSKWAELSDTQKLIIEQACRANMLQELADSEAEQADALEEMRKKGVQFRQYPPAVLTAIESKWQEVVAEESARSANFRRVWESYAKFRAGFGIWRDRGYVK